MLGCRRDSDVTSTTARFMFDALNRRVARWDSSTNAWRYFVASYEGIPLAETKWQAGTWATDREYIHLDGRPLAQIQGGRAYYFHVNHIDLPRMMTNESGQTIWSAAGRPYGDITETPGLVDPLSGQTVVTNLRLPGQYDERLLGSVGLQGPYYNWNRWYLPSVGRYMALDPIALGGGFNAPSGVSWYGYAFQNPQLWTDRLGLTSLIFNRQNGTITIFDKDGHDVGQYAADNNAQTNSRGPWENGVYTFLTHTTHPDDAPNSRFGTNGNFVFNNKGSDPGAGFAGGCGGCGVHSGRANMCDQANRCGVHYATEGCIRTTDDATKLILDLINGGDFLTTLSVE
jgi:RHS repeat-associated protein